MNKILATALIVGLLAGIVGLSVLFLSRNRASDASLGESVHVRPDPFFLAVADAEPPPPPEEEFFLPPGSVTPLAESDDVLFELENASRETVFEDVADPENVVAASVVGAETTVFTFTAGHSYRVRAGTNKHFRLKSITRGPRLLVLTGGSYTYTGASLANVFAGSKLQRASFPRGFGADIEDLSRAFAESTELTELTLPHGFGANATNLTGIFSVCYNLPMGPGFLPARFGQKALLITQAFATCHLLTSLDGFLPRGFGLEATDMRSLFADTRLTSVKGAFEPGFGGKALDMSGFFQACPLTEGVDPGDFPAGFGAVAENLALFFGETNMQSLAPGVLPAGFGAAALNVSGFLQLTPLTTLLPGALPAGFGSEATDVSHFLGESHISSVPAGVLPNGFGAKALNISGFVRLCLFLEHIEFPAGFGAVTTTANEFADGLNIARPFEVIFPEGFGRLITSSSSAFQAGSPGVARRISPGAHTDAYAYIAASSLDGEPNQFTIVVSGPLTAADPPWSLYAALGFIVE